MGLVAKSADTYAERIAPLLVSSDLEGHSGAMFDPKGFAILPSPNDGRLHEKVHSGFGSVGVPVGHSRGLMTTRCASLGEVILFS
jgi:hypothetical protein